MKILTKLFLISGTSLEMAGSVIIISLIFKIEVDNKKLEDKCENYSICDVLKKQKEKTERDKKYCIAGLVCIILGFVLKVYGYHRE